MTIMNREAFLEHVTANLHRPRRTNGVERPQWSIRPQDEVLKGLSKDELVDVLEEHCKVIHTNFKRTDRDGLAAILKETIEGYKAKAIVASSDSRNEDYGLHDFYQKLKDDGNEVHLWDETNGKENQAFAERADVGITFSDITLAESGTVTLFNNKYNGRSISLMPRTYIAIIPKSTIVPRMTQATKQIHEANQAGDGVASCISFVTGPSNSADIEMNLIVGVHGPVDVTYIMVED
ncbi:L-lactate dehydrogenase complex protein LldG [Lentibacillus halodurans]|uniref:Lactate utilization protein C n=1 Tax=Lentibacillus halodurans TaxID=237679 RepID=A0A1I0W4Y0_9BACI|nr:lactate utilization protein C [Lentibacillus halodurans]SFA83825.1 L-lactate dehydrogenase complex protein LldG [Lentibacillus halodurans]